jgi:hypothetical protein
LFASLLLTAFVPSVVSAPAVANVSISLWLRPFCCCCAYPALIPAVAVVSAVAEVASGVGFLRLPLSLLLQAFVLFLASLLLRTFPLLLSSLLLLPSLLLWAFLLLLESNYITLDRKQELRCRKIEYRTE